MKTAKLVNFEYLSRSDRGRDWEDRWVDVYVAVVDGKFYAYDVDAFKAHKVFILGKEKARPIGNVRQVSAKEYPVLDYSVEEYEERVYNGFDLMMSTDEFKAASVNRNYRWMASKMGCPIVCTEKSAQSMQMINWL